MINPRSALKLTQKPCLIAAVLLPLACLALAALPTSAAGAAEMAPAPVTTYTLVERAFERGARLTGSVGLYRQEKIGFEVGGRVELVHDLGTEVEGPVYDEAGQVVRQGDVVARVDDSRYRLRVGALEARLEALDKDLEAQRIDVEQVARANLDAAEAQLSITASDIVVAERQLAEAEAEVTRAQRDYDRQANLRESNSAAFQQKALDDAQSGLDTAIARSQQQDAQLEARRQARDAQKAAVGVAEATIRFKQAQLAATESRIAEVQQDLQQAKIDLEDTVLRAPFSGRVTDTHAARGAVITGGQPIVTLTLMDPVQVRLEVSADMERRIRTGDRAWVFPKDPISPDLAPVEVNALVFEKGAVADPGTRTFRIDLIVRNRRRLFKDVDPTAADLPVITDFLAVVRRYEGEPGPLFVPTASILQEDGKTYVLRLPGIGFNESASRNAVGKHVPEKIQVELGDDYLTVISWNFRSLRASGGLREGDFLVIDPSADYLDGLVIDRPQWLFRPGDLVPVRFAFDATPKGFWVPIYAITKSDDAHIVYVVVDGRAEAVPVNVHETHGELRRISGDGIDDGAVVIVAGIQAVSQGQPVTVIRQMDHGDEPVDPK